MKAAITVTKIRNYELNFRFENKNGKRGCRMDVDLQGTVAQAVQSMAVVTGREKLHYVPTQCFDHEQLLRKER